ncbi:hypothetical protein LVD15_17345 [Fulvivirga maritima]|uniref:hypothetical protein n=1 Tax=Fulvivirga maritima TaxID=2904247 RepID=UPI001F4138D9|nr:hypothetical protein [Fulvivirga maritima]UII25066.1 hypothetical protein LVD15_17345 [Fulvivirga maritima]
MNYIIITITGVAGVLLTFFVSHDLKQGPIRASAGLSLLVALTFEYIPLFQHIPLSESIPYVFIGGSFIGMVSSEVIHSYTFLTVSGIIFSVLYLNASHYFNGYGGALGTTACISLLVSISLWIYSNKIRHWFKDKRG